MREAEAFLGHIYDLNPDGPYNNEADDLNAFWSDLDKKGQARARHVAQPLKGILEEFNAMGDEIFE